MLRKGNFWLLQLILMLTLSALACGPPALRGEVQETVGAAQETVDSAATEVEDVAPSLEAALTENAPEIEQALTAIPDLEEALPEEVPLVGERQWAARASATSEYGSDSWSANQATGEPDVPECGDHGEAWASQFSNGVDTLTLEYDTPFFITGVEIHQSYNPGSITRVTVSDGGSNSQVIYEAEPAPVETCPFVLAVTDIVLFPVSQVVIDVDQTLIGSWNEIDAVALVGAPAE